MGREWWDDHPGSIDGDPDFSTTSSTTTSRKVAVDTKGTNTESDTNTEWDRTDNLKVECERLKREVDFHREVSKEVGASPTPTAAELERTKRRVEFLESLKDEWDAQFKDLSAETERYRAEAEAAREETLAAEALAAAARAAATAASAEAKSPRKNVISDNGSDPPRSSGRRPERLPRPRRAPRWDPPRCFGGTGQAPRTTSPRPSPPPLESASPNWTPRV